MSIVKFKPICMERAWGGRRLGEVFGRDLPEGKKIGETWEVVDRQEAQSVVAEGPLAGLPLRELITRQPQRLLGEAWLSPRPFPILVKWLDCAERLSLQVHPPAVAAAQLGGEPKTENWYVAEALSGASLIAGLRKGVTRKSFLEALHLKNLEELCHRFSSMAGDSLLVESGRIHAIDAGNLILEVQQNSDTTYRVFDWGRMGLDGQPRELHIEESMQCIDFEDFEPEPLRTDFKATEQIIAECSHFRIRKFVWENGCSGNLSPAGSDAALLHLLTGELVCGDTALLAGDTGLCPYSEDCQVLTLEGATFLCTDCFIGQGSSRDSR